MRKIFIIISFVLLFFFVTGSIFSCSNKKPVKEEKIKLKVETNSDSEKKDVDNDGNNTDKNVKKMESELKKLKEELSNLKNYEAKEKDENDKTVDLKIEKIKNDPANYISAWSKKKVTIDGVINKNEWKEAKEFKKKIRLRKLIGGEAGSLTMIVKAKNDNKFLYLGIAVVGDKLDDTIKTGLDLIMVRFDNNSSGSLDSLEDFKYCFLLNKKSTYEDAHFQTGPEKREGKKEKDIRKDGIAKIRYFKTRKGYWVHSAEFKIELSSGDEQDINMKPGDIVKWNVMFVDKFLKFGKMRVGGLYNYKMDISADWQYLILSEKEN